MRIKSLSNLLIGIAIFLFTSSICLCVSEYILKFVGYNSFFADTYEPNSYTVRKNIEFNYSFKSNSEGLREKEIPKTKAENEFRILFLGDSFTEGVGVETNERYTDLLADLIKLKSGKKLTIINAAIAATGPTEYARVLTHVGLNYQPDMVVIGLFANDIQNIVTDFSEAALKEKYPPAYKLDNSISSKIILAFPRNYRVAVQTIPRLLRPAFFKRIQKEVQKQNIPSDRYNAWKIKITDQTAKNIDTFRINETIYTTGLFNPDYYIQALDLVGFEKNYENLTKTIDYIKSALLNTPLYLVYIPCNLQNISEKELAANPLVLTGTNINPEWRTKESKFESEIKRYCEMRAINFYNLTEDLRQANLDGETTNYAIDAHLNKKGHEIVAKKLAGFFCENLECNKDYQ